MGLFKQRSGQWTSTGEARLVAKGKRPLSQFPDPYYSIERKNLILWLNEEEGSDVCLSICGKNLARPLKARAFQAHFLLDFLDRGEGGPYDTRLVLRMESEVNGRRADQATSEWSELEIADAFGLAWNFGSFFGTLDALRLVLVVPCLLTFPSPLRNDKHPIQNLRSTLFSTSNNPSFPGSDSIQLWLPG